MRWQLEPLGAWPHERTANPKSSRIFRAKWSDTLDLLDRELDKLDVTGAVAIRIDVEPGQVRRDGMLYANAKVRSPGVIVSFTGRYGPLSYATDTYAEVWAGDPPAWQANVRAIALGLEALRAVDRYGITRSGEQYRGWTAIEAGPAAGFASADAALRWLADRVGSTSQPDTIDIPWLLRAAAHRLHPDVGGDPADWALYDKARQLLTGGAS